MLKVIPHMKWTCKLNYSIIHVLVNFMYIHIFKKVTFMLDEYRGWTRKACEFQIALLVTGTQERGAGSGDRLGKFSCVGPFHR